MDWKKLKSSIPLSRLVAYLIIAAQLPLVFVIYDHMKKKKDWGQISERIYAVRHLSEVKTRKQYLNNVVREKYQEVDQFYLDNQLESLSFLGKERETLEDLIQNPSFTGNEAAEKRYSYITGSTNRLEFTEGNVQTGEGLTESIATLMHPVEIDAQDLKEILTRIEGNRSCKPQLVITDFKLNKKTHPNGNEVYECNMKLLKREFLK